MVTKNSLHLLLVLISTIGYTQVLEFSELEKLPLAVNSEDEESLPIFSPDGKTLFFTRSMHAGNKGGKYAGQDIWVSKYEEGVWRKADNSIFPFNNNYNNAVVGVSADGKTIYMLNVSPSKKMRGISFSKKINGQWTAPEDILINGIENDGSIAFYVSPDFDVIFLSMKGKDSLGEEDIYVTTKSASGEWTKPKNLGPTINTSGFEISPFLSPDKKRLYFSSNGHPGMGDADIFYSERLYDSWETWTTPRNLGKPVNSEKFDAYFSIIGDTLILLTSTRASKLADIHKAKVVKSNQEKENKQVEDILKETQELLENIKNAPDYVAENSSDVLLFFQDNSISLYKNSEEDLRKYLDFMKRNPSKKLRVEYAGKIMESTKVGQLLIRDRLNFIKRSLKDSSIAEDRVEVSSNFTGAYPSDVLMNALQLKIK
ncbi:MAG: PD40 domain-containing protein [Cyclobacteriaceae bacterium]|nr:PD40 domain-containing protein [Cyclobacteriaceae bacterium]